MSLYVYNGVLQRILKGIKYRFITDAVPEFLNTIKPDHIHKYLLFRKIIAESVIQPIPLHPQRLRERGFNQAELFAAFFSRILTTPLLYELVRTKDTPYQAQQSDEHNRHVNVRGAFKVNESEKILGKTIILVDDVVTSGSTVREAARTLKRAGALKVFVFSIARG